MVLSLYDFWTFEVYEFVVLGIFVFFKNLDFEILHFRDFWISQVYEFTVFRNLRFVMGRGFAVL